MRYITIAGKKSSRNEPKYIPISSHSSNINHVILAVLNFIIFLRKDFRVLKFKQSEWMKKYIDFNTEKIMKAANGFGNDFFKLMINSV